MRQQKQQKGSRIGNMRQQKLAEAAKGVRLSKILQNARKIKKIRWKKVWTSGCKAVECKTQIRNK